MEKVQEARHGRGRADSTVGLRELLDMEDLERAEGVLEEILNVASGQPRDPTEELHLIVLARDAGQALQSRTSIDQAVVHDASLSKFNYDSLPDSGEESSAG
jgi:hypothetical protein